MSTGKDLPGHKASNNHSRRNAPGASLDDDWFEPDNTQVDARIEDRSDWARPHDPSTVQHIEKMLEEVLVDVPVRPIEDHRAAPDSDAIEPMARAKAAGSGSRKVVFAIAGIVVVAAAAWLLFQNGLLPVKF
jgi:hypothetical protein